MIINETLVAKNTPISRRKANVMECLVSFFNESTLCREEIAKDIVKSIKRFENGHRMKVYDMSKLKVVDFEVFRKYTPCHRRKRAFYYALIAYLDAVLTDEMTCTIKYNYSPDNLGFLGNIPMLYFPCEMGMLFIKKDIRDYFDIPDTYDEEEEPKAKEYQVNVHFDVVVPISVSAYDEEGALVEAEQNVNVLDFTNYNITKSEIVK